jgi:predicted nucleotidyltransferase component of viral defense system
MLFFPAIDPPTLELLSRLMHSSKLENLRLAGGTSLALQIGHRKSVDLDLFGEIDLNIPEMDMFLKGFENVTSIKRSENFNIFIINNIKVDIVNYPFPWLDHMVKFENIRMAALKDIAAMKLAAVTGRGSKKDFVDLYFLLSHFSFEQMLFFYKNKYPDASEYLLLKSLTYFEDAETEPMPEMLKALSWHEVKESLLEIVRAYNDSLI